MSKKRELKKEFFKRWFLGDDELTRDIWSFIETALKQKEKEVIKLIEERIAYGKKYRLKNKECLRSGWSGIESGKCCKKCEMRKEHFTGHADALKAAVGCRNPFQLKEVCECHLPFRKVAEESIQKVLKEILDSLKLESK